MQIIDIPSCDIPSCDIPRAARSGAGVADTMLGNAFRQIVEPMNARAPRPRCGDGHGTLTHLFFSDEPLDIARAKAICGKCDLADSCREGAIERSEPWGVWGGVLIENGRPVMVKRPRGRPPKNARPELVVDEVPLPPHLVA